MKPTQQPCIEAADPWTTHNTQPLSAREKLAHIQQEQGDRSNPPQPGSARHSGRDPKHQDIQQQHTQDIER